MLKTMAVIALLGSVVTDFEIDAPRISAMRILAQERENLFGKVFKEKIVDYGVSIKNGEPYVYITAEKVIQIKLPKKDEAVLVRETTLIDKDKTAILTQLIKQHSRVKRLRSLIIIKDKKDHTHITIDTNVSLKNKKQLFVNIGTRIKNRKIEEVMRLHLE